LILKASGLLVTCLEDQPINFTVDRDLVSGPGLVLVDWHQKPAGCALLDRDGDSTALVDEGGHRPMGATLDVVFSPGCPTNRTGEAMAPRERVAVGENDPGAAAWRQGVLAFVGLEKAIFLIFRSARSQDPRLAVAKAEESTRGQLAPSPAALQAGELGVGVVEGAVGENPVLTTIG
jgi:hypothetical protein